MFLQETREVKTLWLPSHNYLQPLVACALRKRKDLTPRQDKQLREKATLVAAGKDEAHVGPGGAIFTKQRREAKGRGIKALPSSSLFLIVERIV